MSDVPASTAPAAPATASTNAAPAPAQSANEPKMVALSEDAYRELNNAVQRANRIANETQAKLAELQKQHAAPVDPPKPPAGVEERLNKLASELEQERHARAEEKLQIKIMEAAAKYGVAPDRVDFLDYKLRKSNAGLTADGVPDATNPSARVSIDTLVESLLSTKEGAVFKTAPTAASLPTATSKGGAATAKKTLKMSEWAATRNAGGEAYKQLHAAVKAGEVALVDD